MNKESIKLDNNTYAVIDEIGNIRIVSTINSNNQETMKKILLKENDIEELEEKLNHYKKLQAIKIDSIFSTTLDILALGMIILVITLFKQAAITGLIPVGLTGSFAIITKLINYSMYGSRKKRKKLKQEAEYEIPNLEQIIENTKKELEKLKEETIFTELTNTHELTSNSSEHKYVYKYNPNNQDLKNLKEEEKTKEIHVLKLTK